jgi:hypothetical protein
VIALLLTACSTLSTLDGAKTLPPGEVQLGGAISLQNGNSPVAQAGIPLPVLEIAGRVGLAEDVDLGFRAYLLGLGGDVRYRFFHDEKWNAATGVGVYGLPIPGSGSVETRFPVTLERDLIGSWSISGGPRIILRDQWNQTDGGTVARVDVFSGAGLRTDVAYQRLILGVGGDLYARPTRHSPPAWSLAISVGWRSRHSARSAASSSSP